MVSIIPATISSTVTSSNPLSQPIISVPFAHLEIPLSLIFLLLGTCLKAIPVSSQLHTSPTISFFVSIKTDIFSAVRTCTMCIYVHHLSLVYTYAEQSKGWHA